MKILQFKILKQTQCLNLFKKMTLSHFKMIGIHFEINLTYINYKT